MLKTSILMSFLAACYNALKNSITYKVVTRIIDFIGNMICGTVLFRGLKALGNEFPRNDSYFYKLIKFISNKVFSAAEKIKKVSEGGLLYKGLSFVFGKSFIFNPENFLMLGIAVIFICPHEMWNNLYGLMFAAAVSVIYLFGNGKPRAEKIWLPMILFAIMAVFSVVISKDVKDSVRVFLFFATSFMLCTVVFAMLKSEKQFDRMCMTMFLVLIVTGAVAICQKIIGVEVDELLTDVEMSGNLGRVFSTLANPNNFAEFLIIFFPFCFAYAITRAKKKALFTAALLIPFGALLFTYSRSGWLGFAVTAVTFVILYNKKLLPALVVLGIMMIPLLPASVMERIMTIGNLEDTSSSYRIDIWTGTFKMLQYFWYSGVGLGPGAFSVVYPDFAVKTAAEAPHTHMLFLEVFAEMGIIGLLCFVLLTLCLVSRCSVAASKMKEGSMKLYSVAAAASMMGILTIGFAEYVWFYPRVMFAFFIAIGMAMAAEKISAVKNFEG